MRAIRPMTNYRNIAVKTTLVSIIIIFIAKYFAVWVNPMTNYNPAIFSGVTTLLLLYSLTDFFITSKPAEASGTYRRIPILATTIALSLSGMIAAIPLGRDYWIVLGFNFILFVASLIFITHIVVASINHNTNGRHPLSDPEEVQKLFWLTLSHSLVALAAFLTLIYFFW